MRLKRAADLNKQSQGAFLEQAGDDRARRILLEWAIARRKQGMVTYSELAADTGLAVEEIMAAMELDPEEASDLFLKMCEAVADAQGMPGFLRLAESVVGATPRARPDPRRTEGGG
jgi:hypothetical protein